MFIELHMLQNFAPSCLNRDDTNSPKDCVFGGARRARISSQCMKRAMRSHVLASGDLDGNLGVRSKRLQDLLVEKATKSGKDAEEAATVTEFILGQVGFKLKKKKEEQTGLTEYVIFIGRDEIDTLGSLMLKHWDDVLQAAGAKKKDDQKVPKELEGALKIVLDGRSAADIAMFGRMLANVPDKNVDAACQVAHAISTHKVDMEMDFFTAVDDLKPEDTSGADMMGTVEFNSACFYRYSVIHWEQLLKNLGGDVDLAKRTVRAFLLAAVEAIPTGKQSTFAAHNLPAVVFAVVREAGAPWSLANAFENPVRANGHGVVTDSMERLSSHWACLTRMYGNGASTRGVWCALNEEAPLANLGERKERVTDVVQAVMDKLPGGVS